MLALLAISLVAQSSLACPDCAPGRAARAAIAADPERWLHAFAVAAPFLVVAAVVALAHRARAQEVQR